MKIKLNQQVDKIRKLGVKLSQIILTIKEQFLYSTLNIDLWTNFAF